MFIYFGKIGLLDTRYFSKMKFPHMFGWCFDVKIAHCWAEWSSDVYAALGIFNCRLQFPWLKIALRVPVHSLTLWNVFGHYDTAVANRRLSDGSVAITGPLIYFFFGVMTWLGHHQT